MVLGILLSQAQRFLVVVPSVAICTEVTGGCCIHAAKGFTYSHCAHGLPFKHKKCLENLGISKELPEGSLFNQRISQTPEVQAYSFVPVVASSFSNSDS